MLVIYTHLILYNRFSPSAEGVVKLYCENGWGH